MTGRAPDACAYPRPYQQKVDPTKLRMAEAHGMRGSGVLKEKKTASGICVCGLATDQRRLAAQQRPLTIYRRGWRLTVRSWCLTHA